jgi:hypothetical protein
MKKNYLINILVLFIFTFITQCKTDEVTPSNIILYNKPLKTIQQCINGKWKLEYSYGGLLSHKYIETHNSYMTINSDHIIMGDDSRGVVVDTTIIWKREKDVYNDYTYLMGFSWSGYLWPEYQIVDQIKNDTLIIKENGYDGYDYYYTKY